MAEGTAVLARNVSRLSTDFRDIPGYEQRSCERAISSLALQTLRLAGAGVHAQYPGMQGSNGNNSIRYRDGFFVTATRVNNQRKHLDIVYVLEIRDGLVYFIGRENLEPSSETLMHEALLRSLRPKGANAISHPHEKIDLLEGLKHSWDYLCIAETESVAGMQHTGGMSDAVLRALERDFYDWKLPYIILRDHFGPPGDDVGAVVPAPSIEEAADRVIEVHNYRRVYAHFLR